MVMGKVVGTVVASQKDEKLQGTKLQVVRLVGLDAEPKDTFLVAVDSVGAGAGEIVLCCSGSSARMTRATEGKPVDAVIMAIVDSFEVEGGQVYQKHRLSER